MDGFYFCEFYADQDRHYIRNFPTTRVHEQVIVCINYLQGFKSLRKGSPVKTLSETNL